MPWNRVPWIRRVSFDANRVPENRVPENRVWENRVWENRVPGNREAVACDSLGLLVPGELIK